MTLPTITLDEISAAQVQREVTFNENAIAMSRASLFSVHQRRTNGLTLTLYGGNLPTDAGPVQIADQTLTLTPSTTNYVYADSDGVIFATTSQPTGWPGPMSSGWLALYELDVGANDITDGVCYLLAPMSPGPTGAQGAQGIAGTGPATKRMRVAEAVGNDSTNIDVVGFAITGVGTANARSLASTSFPESIPYVSRGGGPAAGSSAAYYSTQNFCHLGANPGEGGFDITFRWCYETSFSPANVRRFVGLYNCASGAIGNVEPSTLINVIGVASNAGDANLSLIYNDGGGTATMATLYSDGSPTQTFPAKSTNNVYELRLQSTANSHIVTYTLTNCTTGDVASGTIDGNVSPSILPAGSQFLGWMIWTNNGSSASTSNFGFMQVAATTRY